MGLFKKKEQIHESICEYDEIKLSFYALSKDPVLKRNQLSVLFVRFKNKFPDSEYSIDTPLKTFMIPEEFEPPEIMALAKHFEATAWHIFIDEERYIDIDFDMMQINMEREKIDECKEEIRTTESFKSDIKVNGFSFNKYPGWLWEKYQKEQYDKLLALANKYLRYGDFYVYSDELDESKICSRDDFDKARNREYILLKSKLDKYRIVFLDTGLKQVLATNLNDLEAEYLSDILKPEIDGAQEEHVEPGRLKE